MHTHACTNTHQVNMLYLHLSSPDAVGQTSVVGGVIWLAKS